MNGTAPPTRTDTVQLLAIDGEFATTREVDFPWLRPPVTSRHLTPRARLAQRWQRFLASQYVADVRAGWARALAVLGVLGVAYFLLLMARGAWVAAELFGTTALATVAVVLAAGLVIGRLLRKWGEAA